METFDYPARRGGQTLAMVKQLPETGAVVIVHTVAMRDYLMRMIRDVRGEAVAKVSRVVVIGGRSDTQRLRGERIPTIVDHAFEEEMPRELVGYVLDLVRNLNVRPTL